VTGTEAPNSTRPSRAKKSSAVQIGEREGGGGGREKDPHAGVSARSLTAFAKVREGGVLLREKKPEKKKEDSASQSPRGRR